VPDGSTAPTPALLPHPAPASVSVVATMPAIPTHVPTDLTQPMYYASFSVAGLSARTSSSGRKRSASRFLTDAGFHEAHDFHQPPYRDPGGDETLRRAA
jgi:hypothetical protein